MQITRVDVTPLSVPFSKPVRWRYGTMAGVTTALVRVRTDSGVEGIGEAPGVPGIRLVLDCLEFFEPALVGADPMEVRGFVERAEALGAMHFPYVANVGLAAIEMALWDICGKALGAPVHQLFGGKCTTAIEFYWHVNSPEGTPEEAVVHAGEGLDRGYTTLYVKGSDNVRADLELMQALRRLAGPEIALRLDPNEGWRPLDCLGNRDLLAEVGLELLEQPFALRALDDLRQLREVLGIPVAANQSAWLLADVHDVLEARAADAVVTGLHQAGGLLNLDAAHVLCRTSRVPLIRHSLCDLGIATAAALQLLATWPEAGLAHQTHLQLVEHDLLSPRFEFEGGRLSVPRGPGLGVELDEDAVRHFAANFERNGEYRSYGP
ncbi:MAG: mandelate racemase/muconate lactonizing enzyme family protein [Acidimicrobiales bacterium]